MDVISEENEKMVSNTTNICNICNDKSKKIAKIHNLQHNENNFINCFKCKKLYEKTDYEHFQEHCEEMFNTSLFPCDILSLIHI